MGRPCKRVWTEERATYLAESWLNMKAREIGAVLGVSKYAILRQARRMQLPYKQIHSPPRPKEEKRELQQPYLSEFISWEYRRQYYRLC